MNSWNHSKQRIVDIKLEHNRSRSPLQQLWTKGIMSISDVTALGGICGFDELSEVSI